MNDQTLFVKDEGTEIILDIGIPAETITLAQIRFKSTSVNLNTVTAQPVLGTTTINYFTTGQEFSKAGTYSVQAYIETPDWKGSGDITTIKVSDTLEATGL